MKKFLRFLPALLAAAFFIAACSSSAPAGDITPAQAEKMLQSDKSVVVIDVRTPEEFVAGRIPGALNIDVRGEGFEDSIAALDKDGRYLVYCRSGVRSASARNIMEKSGFKNIYNMKGGFTAWKGPSESGR